MSTTARPTNNPCLSHTLNNTGACVFTRDNVPYAFLFRKQYQAIIQYSKIMLLHSLVFKFLHYYLLQKEKLEVKLPTYLKRK